MNDDVKKAKQKKDYDGALSIRFTRQDLAKLADLKVETGLSRADVIRHLIRKAELPTPRSTVDQKALVQLGAIGNNLNQIAKALNSASDTRRSLLDAEAAALAARDEVRKAIGHIIGGGK